MTSSFFLSWSLNIQTDGTGEEDGEEDGGGDGGGDSEWLPQTGVTVARDNNNTTTSYDHLITEEGGKWRTLEV